MCENITQHEHEGGGGRPTPDLSQRVCGVSALLFDSNVMIIHDKQAGG